MHQITRRIGRSLLVIGAILLALVIAGCTRSRGAGIVPTTTPAGGGGVDATMKAVFAGTQTAVALAPETGGGGELTPTPVILPTLVLVPTATPPAPTPVRPTATVAGPKTYTVKPGDWIFKIARELGVDPQALIAANPGVNPNNIQPGQVLTVPAAGAPITAPASPTTYVVQPGEWIFQIARKLGKDPGAIIAANPGVNPNNVQPGQVLIIP